MSSSRIANFLLKRYGVRLPAMRSTWRSPNRLADGRRGNRIEQRWMNLAR